MDVNTLALTNLIQKYDINEPRARRVALWELKAWSPKEVAGLLDQLRPVTRKAGTSEPCGPVCNRWDSALPLWIRLTIWAIVASGTGLLLPLQICGSVYLFVLGRWKAIVEEIPRPTLKLLLWSRKMQDFIKAPITLIRKSIDQQTALCVNRSGKLKLLSKGYTVMSYAWGEVMGWQSTKSWGPVEPSMRKRGIMLAHFLKFFDRCQAEWLWVDVIAMPEVFEEMTDTEKRQTEELRTGVINSLRQVYMQADKILILDSLLLRLQTGSLIDAAIVLTLGRWITRLWTYTEVRLAKKVLLRTGDSAFDLDEIILYISRAINNTDHRYHPLLSRLTPLRPTAPGGQRKVSASLRPGERQPHILADIYDGCENRYCDVDIDRIRVLYPILDLEWQTGWTLQEGVDCVKAAFPEHLDILRAYCNYRSLDVNL